MIVNETGCLQTGDFYARESASLMQITSSLVMRLVS